MQKPPTSSTPPGSSLRKTRPRRAAHDVTTRVERTLLAIRGFGPWSINYLVMRALSFADYVPLGDTGVTSGLQALLKLEPRPDLDTACQLMTVFSPYRSLATAQLWQFNQTFSK